jgi:hypothetical protein
MQGDKAELETMSFANDEKVLVNYHSKSVILNCFKQFDFELVDYKEQIFPELNGNETIDMIFIFSKTN